MSDDLRAQIGALVPAWVDPCDITDFLDAILTLVEQAIQQAREKAWRCFHCDEVFTDKAEAREHFGANQDDTPACGLSADDVKVLRQLEADNDELHRENERLDNDARLWHESEADRVRRIGNVQWWQEMDSREGEKLVAESALAEKDAQIAALRDADQVLTVAVKASEENWGWAFNEMTDEQGEALNAFFVSVSKVLRETPALPQAQEK